MSQKTIAEVLAGLYLCGPDYHEGACEKCPFIKDCLPGDNDALLEEAAMAIETLLSRYAETTAKLALIVEYLQS